MSALYGAAFLFLQAFGTVWFWTGEALSAIGKWFMATGDRIVTFSYRIER